MSEVEVAPAYTVILIDDDEVLGPDEGENDVLSGMRMKMCLMTDEECVKSVLEYDRGRAPFVKAVDLRLKDDNELGYLIYFKVAISALVTEFYLALAEFDDPKVLYRSDNEIWVFNDNKRLL
ncbi:hypothetical protein K469DRAFT_693137 [Zopfia rhizophila CBS 207.26]|uniref:Uncharacterized protein n=1 Tax=Zopfia rhizophila CBS 207.26 TaxID=1314779 RepID=A0A6A6EP66_9PEZI|nr:hypothetical protein K469DRAFT_693137 [Zopfia rhizophila CBS 207.26]